jgi:hypothetical protein
MRWTNVRSGLRVAPMAWGVISLFVGLMLYYPLGELVHWAIPYDSGYGKDEVQWVQGKLAFGLGTPMAFPTYLYTIFSTPTPPSQGLPSANLVGWR